MKREYWKRSRIISTNNSKFTLNKYDAHLLPVGENS